ncbi:MAG: fumarylacetoacetate hydrolase family protein [Candidatus Binataceae bacterium]
MKLALFNDYLPGVVVGDRIVDVSDVVGREVMNLRPYDRMPEIIVRFERLKEPLQSAVRGEGVAVSSVRLRAPLPRPSKMLNAIGNYYEFTKTPKKPIGLFLKAPSSVLDPGGTVELPPHQAKVFHHEAELAVVIGKSAAKVSEQDANNFIFGYTCFIDVSARGLGDGVGFTGKSFDTFAPIGPWIVTKDEIPDPLKLQIRFWVNDEPRHDYNTSDMEHSPAELLSWASAVSTLEPGDVISTGTNHQQIGPVQDGETITIEIERIGRMSAKVHDALKRKWPKEIDKPMADWVRERRTNPNAAPPSIMIPNR